MVRRAVGSIAVGLVAAMVAGTAISGQWDDGCAQWPTEEFFQEATAADVRSCLDAGADPRAVNHGGGSALHAATSASAEPDFIRVLLDAGADVNARDTHDETPLTRAFAAAEPVNPTVVEALLDGGAEPNVVGGAGWTPLHSASYEAEAVNIVSALLAAGAELEARTALHFHSAGGETPLHIAVRSGASAAVVGTLLASGADVEALDGNGFSPMHGLHKASGEVVTLLLDAGGKLETRSPMKTTVLHSAAGARPGVIRRLLEAGADVDARDYRDATPLHRAAEESDQVAALELLLAAGADPMARDRAGATPLHRAAEGRGGPALFRALLDAEAQVDARDHSGRTPLFYAAENPENPAAFRTLRKAGAAADARLHDGQTLLHAAAYGDNPAMVETLLELDADVNARDSNGSTPLHGAAWHSGWNTWDELQPSGPWAVYGDTAVVEALLAAGADVQARDRSGYTPLHAAAALNKNPTVLELLLLAGADPDARNSNDETALDLAFRRPPLEKREVLRSYPIPAAVRALQRGVGGSEAFRDCPSCPDLLVMPSGRFRMGCIYEDYACWSKAALPAREVEVAAFALSKFEVTRGQFTAFTTATGYEVSGSCRVGERSWHNQVWQTDEHPVVCVRWRDAQAYVGWLREQTGRPYRLPSEAEWEYASRAGMTTRFHWGYRAPDLCIYENADGYDCHDEWEKTAPVGSFRANGFGLHDMVGNVSEWVDDCWHENYDGAPADGSAWLDGGDCLRRVVRGGSWESDLRRHHASSDRNTRDRGMRWDRLGFRVARDLDPQ